MKTRIQARAITFDPKRQAIILVRNPNATFWYVPGGGLEENEDIRQCAVREVLEETGLHIKLGRMLYAQELHDKKDQMVIIELFWLAGLSHDQELRPNHNDTDSEGGVVEAKWFTKEQLQNITVYPEQLKDSFWQNIDKLRQEEDPFLGVF